MANKPRLVTHTEPSEAVFVFGDRVLDEIHVFLREEAGKFYMEICGGRSITIHPRAAQVLGWVQPHHTVDAPCPEACGPCVREAPNPRQNRSG